jgi:hypothetical protein
MVRAQNRGNRVYELDVNPMQQVRADVKRPLKKEKQKWTAAEKKAWRSLRRSKQRSKRLVDSLWALTDDSTQGSKVIGAAAADHLADTVQQP